MQNFLNIKLDLPKMTLNELNKVRKETRKLLLDIEWQIQIKKMPTSSKN